MAALKKILWLTSWYPNRKDMSNGDFIQRHATAVAPFVNLTVLTIIKDEEMSYGTVEIEKIVENNFTEYKVYYGRSRWGGWIERLFSYRAYTQLQKKMFRHIVAEQGNPDLVHVHVAMKAGLLALWLKKYRQLTYLVTEHWAGYYHECVPNIYDANWLIRQQTKKILEGAALFLPVSAGLGETVKKNFANVPYRVIPNVVDTNLFYYKEQTPPVFRFIHVSYMNYQKNPEGILEAAGILKQRGVNFELHMTGNQPENLIEKAREKGLLDNCVFFERSVPYASVAARMQEASAFLLFSRFENLPCVILEALCCGLPVISTNVGGIAEVVHTGNGILVDNESVTQLADAMQKMIEEYGRFNRKEIAATATDQFNYNRIGQTHLDIYELVTGKQ